ncbi:pyridoxamine 5'-phosphate oxidase, partial [Helicobacter bizzozeronii]|uniref:pyridoxamine 5'-phosphate oxidase n=1 Tax=Helicobacter bizzozeronii TaxID=56877 RepID=UPI002553B3D6
LRRADLLDDPIEQLRRWYDQAREAGLHEPDAVVVSTVAADGTPSSRYVLMRGLDTGVVFFTNYQSRKGHEIDDRAVAAVVFPWHWLSRQVRVVGRVERVSEAESDAYFASRPRGSQIGAWASPQSEPLVDRAQLEALTAEVEDRFDGVEVPRPPHWGGYRVVPDEVEVWQGRPDRLHDRFAYRRDPSAPTGWALTRLAP